METITKQKKMDKNAHLFLTYYKYHKTLQLQFAGLIHIALTAPHYCSKLIRAEITSNMYKVAR